MNATFLTAIAVVVLAVWVIFGNSGDGLDETWDIVFGVAAGILALIAAALSLPRTRRAP